MNRWRRWVAYAIVVIALLAGAYVAKELLTSGAAVKTVPRVTLTIREANTMRLINHERTSRGLHSLALDPALVVVARHHSTWMLKHSYFDHDEPPQSYAARMYTAAGHRYSFNENIAWGNGNYGTSVYLVRNWMASHYHRLNILDPRMRRIGVGIVVGSFEGNGGSSMATTDEST